MMRQSTVNAPLTSTSIAGQHSIAYRNVHDRLLCTYLPQHEPESLITTTTIIIIIIIIIIVVVGIIVVVITKPA